MSMPIPIPRTSPPPDEASLVASARRGEEWAIRTLVRRCNSQLFRVARSVLRDDTEAEDAVQAAYVTAFTRLSEFRGDAAFETWLVRICLNEAIGRRRRARASVDLDALDAEVGRAGGQVIMFPTSLASPDPEAEAGRRQVRRMLEDAVDGLPDAFRLVFVLRDVQGLGIEETAERLGIRPETVKTRLHRARRQLRRALEQSLAPSFGEIYPFDGERCADMAERVLRSLSAG